MRYVLGVIILFNCFACAEKLDSEKSSDRTGLDVSADFKIGETSSSNSHMEKCEKKSDCHNERDLCFNKFCIDGGVSACKSGSDCRTNESCSINATEICDTCIGAICVPSQQCDANTDCQSGEIFVPDMGRDFDHAFESDVGTD